MVQMNLTYYENLYIFFPLHLLKNFYEHHDSVTLAAASANEEARDLSSSDYEHRELNAEMQGTVSAITHSFKFWGSITFWRRNYFF